MSKKLVTKEIPDIIPVRGEDLSVGEKFALIHCYNHNVDEPFVVCTRGRETILVNKELPNIEDTIRLINKIMAMKYINSKTEKLFDDFQKLYGKDASTVLLYIWLDWRKERESVDLNNRAMDILEKIKKSKLMKKYRRENDIISELFSIGFGTYEDGAKCDFDKGKENVFLYGYLQGIKFAEGKKVGVQA